MCCNNMWCYTDMSHCKWAVCEIYLCNTTYCYSTYQHEAIISRSRQLLMMGTWLLETCWATSRREIKDNTKVTSSWFFLSTLRKLVRRGWSALIWMWVGGSGGLLQKSDDKRVRSAAFVWRVSYLFAVHRSTVTSTSWDLVLTFIDQKWLCVIGPFPFQDRIADLLNRTQRMLNMWRCFVGWNVA